MTNQTIVERIAIDFMCEDLRPELSVDENYRRLCFLPQSLLFREFDDTFSEVFGTRVMTRGRILRLLLDGGLSSSELAERYFDFIVPADKLFFSKEGCDQ